MKMIHENYKGGHTFWLRAPLTAAPCWPCAPLREAVRYRACAPLLEAARYRACAPRTAATVDGAPTFFDSLGLV